MSQVTDPIADYLTRVRNAIMANHRVVDIPASNLKKEMTKLLKEKGYIDKEVYIGIRPEHIKEVKDNSLTDDESKFSANIEVTEMMGSETYLYLTICDTQVVAIVDSKINKRVGDEVELRADGNNIHLFDIESEKSIF